VDGGFGYGVEENLHRLADLQQRQILFNHLGPHLDRPGVGYQNDPGTINYGFAGFGLDFQHDAVFSL
jgi:hypothetical protein